MFKDIIKCKKKDLFNNKMKSYQVLINNLQKEIYELEKEKINLKKEFDNYQDYLDGLNFYQIYKEWRKSD